MAELPLRLQEITDAVRVYHPTADIDLLKKAYLYAAQHHEGQTRASGEDYIVHPLHVAKAAAELKLDEATIASALLHDTIEDTEASYEELAELFGRTVADIVQGVTKLTHLSFSSREERQAENFRKMLLAMSKDIRVILVKLVDRVHNMRTLQYTSEEARERKAQETMEIYAPLANRLGLYALKSELEDLSFRFLNPDAYGDLEKKLAAGAAERRKFLEQIKAQVEKELSQAGIAAAIYTREKMKYSIYRKMNRQGVPFEQVFDLVAFRAVVDTVEQCWQVLGIVHQIWKPVPGRFRDYISLPKPNGYRSLHTTVMGPGGHQVEVQVRTWEMHDQAERGIAAHWKYKEGKVISPADEAKIRYIKQLIEELLDLDETVKDSVELYSAIKEGLSFDEIFVFTPKGDVKNLPRGATPVDFAFAVHSQVGFQCAGARVNGVMVPLTHQLKNGDVVEILTNAGQRPSQDWLRFIRSSRAKAKIRRVVRTEAKERYLQLGRILVEKELKKRGVGMGRATKGGKLLEAGKSLGMDTEEKMYFQIGSGKLEASDVAAKVAELLDIKAPAPAAEPAKTPSGFWEIFKLSGKGRVLVGGLDDVVTKFGKCCSPLRGERIVGFVTRGRGITVHAADCPYVQVMDQDRLVDVEWDKSGAAGQEVTLKITSRDTPGMLTSMSQVFGSMGVNICQAIVRTSDQTAETVFKIQVKNLGQLKTITRSLMRIQGVEKVDRVKG